MIASTFVEYPYKAFGQLPFEKVYQLLVPLIPGGAFLLCIALVHKGSVSYFTALGPQYVQILLLAVGAYVLGFLLYFLSMTLSAIFALCFLWLSVVRPKKQRQNLAVSRLPIWRGVAAEFLGPNLTPQPPAFAALAQGEAPGLNQAVQAAAQHDSQWQEWYNILQDYLMRDRALISEEFWASMSALQATGWVLLVASFHTSGSLRAELFIVSTLAVLVGLIVPGSPVATYWTQDRLSYWDYTAKLLAEVKQREKGYSQRS